MEGKVRSIYVLSIFRPEGIKNKIYIPAEKKKALHQAVEGVGLFFWVRKELVSGKVGRRISFFFFFF